MIIRIRHALHLYLRLQKFILEHEIRACERWQSQIRENNQTTDTNVNKHISTEAIICAFDDNLIQLTTFLIDCR